MYSLWLPSNHLLRAKLHFGNMWILKVYTLSSPKLVSDQLYYSENIKPFYHTQGITLYHRTFPILHPYFSYTTTILSLYYYPNFTILVYRITTTALFSKPYFPYSKLYYYHTSPILILTIHVTISLCYSPALLHFNRTSLEKGTFQLTVFACG